MENTAILFVHGFMGSHRQFDSLAKLLKESTADLYFHSLTGHGSTLKEFRSTNAKMWQDSVDERLRELSKEYEKVLVVGHSMGGLIAERAAIAVPDKVCGVVAIGYPIKINLKREWLKLNADASKPAKDGEDPRVTAARAMAGVPIHNVGEYLSTFPQNMQFLKTTRLARRDLHLLKAPLIVINFDKDEIVAASVPEFVMAQKPDAKIIMLPESYHFLFTENELPKMADEIKKLL